MRKPQWLTVPGAGPSDWSLDTRQNLPLCKQYALFFWNGTDSQGRYRYLRHTAPECSLFGAVRLVTVLALPGSLAQEPVGALPSSPSLISASCPTEAQHASLVGTRLLLCGLRASFLLEFSSSVPGEVMSPQEVESLKDSLLRARYNQ